jgi:eukaryotic-like serine/threonine-protein kinase
LTPEHWSKVKTALDGALARPEGERVAFLSVACAGDPSLRREVESLIGSAEHTRSLLESPVLADSVPDGDADPMVGRTLGAYRILSRLGAGGMGEVFLAHDSRLGRKVALKLLPEALSADPDRLRRFHLEASAAAALNHPNILVIHAIGEAEGRHFIATEHIEGETLSDRMARGRLEVSEAVEIARQVARGLAAAHAAGVVHRDVKPGNIMLRRDGFVKLLDFGLAKLTASRDVAIDTSAETLVETTPGMVIGTVAYMSPEQVRGAPVDQRSDIFSIGTVLYEMVCGRKPFAGDGAAEVMSAILRDDPPALPALDEIEAIVRRCLQKDASQRFPSADDLGAALQAASRAPSAAAPASQERVRSPTPTRLVVLPFRILRPDAETDFLAFSLPDAITSSLSGLGALVVRSSLVAAHFGGETLDLKKIAAAANVDVVLTGTLLRAGEQLRVSSQLVEAPAGTVVWSQTSHLTLREIFQLQDDLVQRIVESLSLPLTAREHRLLRHDVPASPTAYEFFLRANELTRHMGLGSGDLAAARDLYRRCLEGDPAYAPAWARLARCHRLLGKGGEDPQENLAQAESSLRRALDLNPSLALAHKLYAQLETDFGRPADAMTRLLRRIHPGSTDAELFAGLVHSCRYCGLLDASIAAHAQARHLDPRIPTGVWHTYWLLGDDERALQDMGTAPIYFDALVLTSMGREGEALSILRGREQMGLAPILTAFIRSLRTLLEGKREESLDATAKCLATLDDAEARYYLARQLAHLGSTERAIEELWRVVEQGFYCPQALARDPWLAPLRESPDFAGILQRAESGRRQAAASFLEADGERLLGVRPS